MRGLKKLVAGARIDPSFVDRPGQFGPPKPPTIRSVVFVESKDGKYRTKPVGKGRRE
jgi:hypothetical protein